MSDEVMSSPKVAGEFASVLSDDEETPTRTRLRKDQRTVISLDGLANQHHSQKPVNQVDPILSSISFLLCVFDNIVGPKIVHHWVLDQRELDHVDEQLLKYVAVHTLNGELYQDKLFSNLKYRLYLIQEVDRAIFSVFFDASTVAVASSSNIASNHSAGDLLLNSSESQSSSQSGEQHLSSSALKRHHAASMSKLNAAATTSLNSFSMIVPLERKDILLKYFGDATRFFLNAFENIVLEFKINAHIKPKANHITKAIENLTHSLKEFVSNLITLKVRGLYPYHISEEDEKTGVDFKINIKDTFLNDCFFTTPVATSINNQDKQNFLINAITSHLITNYRTIVVGKTSASINKLINTLALFMPKELLRTSCYALEENSMLSPYFTLQGFVTENPEDLNSILNSDFLFKRDTPTTIVDLSYKHIYRTATLNDFNGLKEDFIKKKVKFLYNCLSLDHLRILFPVNNYLNWISSSSIAQKSTLITSMLKQMDILEIENGSKDAYLSLILKDIYMLSVSLIEYVNNELSSQLKKDTQTSQTGPTKLSARKICKDLDIKSDEDLHILIAHANYLKPGFSLDFYLY